MNQARPYSRLVRQIHGRHLRKSAVAKVRNHHLFRCSWRIGDCWCCLPAHPTRPSRDKSRWCWINDGKKSRGSGPGTHSVLAPTNQCWHWGRGRSKSRSRLSDTLFRSVRGFNWRCGHSRKSRLASARWTLHGPVGSPFCSSSQPSARRANHRPFCLRLIA
jgi:hypothetical protein